jgi:hypothetical protein
LGIFGPAPKLFCADALTNLRLGLPPTKLPVWRGGEQVAAMTGADLNAIEERLLAQLAAMKPPAIRLFAVLGRVDSWIAVRINELRL